MAPFIAALLKGGLSLVANAALTQGKDWVEEKTGVKLSPELTSDQLLQLKQFELENEKELQQIKLQNNQIDAELEKALLADGQSARLMQTAALGQDDLLSKRFVYYFALGWSTFAVIYISAITFLPIPDGNTRFADTILGFLLGTIIASLINFFYGSSRMSKVKDDTLQQLLAKFTDGAK